MKFLFCICAVLAIGLAVDMDCDIPAEEGPRYYPHETNCSLFYECAHGEPWLMECWPGLHFNPEINVCDYPHNVDCVTITTAPPPPTTPVPTTPPITEPATEPITEPQTPFPEVYELNLEEYEI